MLDCKRGVSVCVRGGSLKALAAARVETENQIRPHTSSVSVPPRAPTRPAQHPSQQAGTGTCYARPRLCHAPTFAAERSDLPDSHMMYAGFITEESDNS
eukprot:569106-Rhodomonas_salina.2